MTEPTVTPCGEHFGRVRYRQYVWNVCTCSMNDEQLAAFLAHCKAKAEAGDPELGEDWR